MTVGSLFSGIGGLELGLERAGMTVAWQCEANGYCRRVLAKHWPVVPCIEDVHNVSADTVRRVDLICGGFPCQDISYAGRGAGLAGSRSGLWFEFARVVGELRPRYVLVENVAALLRRGLDAVLGTLATIGYDAEWHCIPAAAVGAPHRRDRVFIVAYANSHGLHEVARLRALDDAGQSGIETRSNAGPASGRYSEAMAVAGGRSPSCGHVQRPGTSHGLAEHPNVQRRQKQLSSAFPSRAQLASWRADQGWVQWGAEPGVGRVADGVPHRVDRLRSLGNAVVPQVAEIIGRAIMAAEVPS